MHPHLRVAKSGEADVTPSLCEGQVYGCVNMGQKWGIGVTVARKNFVSAKDSAFFFYFPHTWWEINLKLRVVSKYRKNKWFRRIEKIMYLLILSNKSDKIKSEVQWYKKYIISFILLEFFKKIYYDIN